jgi:hypothetical protein
MTASTDHGDSDDMIDWFCALTEAQRGLQRLLLKLRGPTEYITGVSDRRVKQRGSGGSTLISSLPKVHLDLQINFRSPTFRPESRLLPAMTPFLDDDPYGWLRKNSHSKHRFLSGSATGFSHKRTIPESHFVMGD